jgi:hypothetical protein
MDVAVGVAVNFAFMLAPKRDAKLADAESGL